MNESGLVTVEFYGIARERAGRAQTDARACTVREAMSAVLQENPGLHGLIDADGSVARHFRVSINGQRFVNDLDEPLQPGDHLLLLSADAGG